MRKYKLIKELPFENSPKIGYISEPHSTQKDGAHYWNHLWFNPENYPEFWQEVVEKDYEILSLARFCSIKPTITDVSDYGDGYIKALLKCDNAIIHSVKRLSDGEVFTVGGEICYKIGNNKSIGKLTRLWVSHEQLRGDVGNLGVVLCHDIDKRNDIIVYRKPLFQTEDGVDIYEDNKDIVYAVNSSFQLINKDWLDKQINHYCKNEGVSFFSSKHLAEEYIIMNKPCLSINDLFNDKNIVQKDSVSKLIITRKDNLIKLVKIKIK